MENEAALQVPKPSCRQWNRFSEPLRVTSMMDYINGGTVSAALSMCDQEVGTVTRSP